MKKYLVIGDPIKHSLSPLIHNYWMNKHGLIDSIYEKRQVGREDLKDIVDQVKSGEIKGANVTVPYKKEIIPLLDSIKGGAKATHSVNTLCKVKNKVFGFNTDIEGFKNSLTDAYINYKNKNIFILGAGGVTSSILEAFANTADKIYIMNRTKEKAEEIKKQRDKLLSLNEHQKSTIEVIEWGVMPKVCDIVINTTSVGLRTNENLDLAFKDYEDNKDTLFYDLIYNPKETNFLKDARLRGNKTMNGKMMFLWQAQIAFQLWTNICPKIDADVIKLLD